MADAKTPEYLDLIGVPFVYGGRGPDTFDCYGLVAELYRRAGQPIPDYRSPTDLAVIAAMMACEAQLWREVPAPKAGAVALIRVGRHASHVGYCLDDMRMIHTWERTGGVVIERLDTWKRHIIGFFEYVGHA
ncbi:C40 family peptidase [Ralstonia pickettii]|uniref:C40 family peptidase n=1 Tax=Ralstonia pickettii TaxID=329 RepID=UPI0027155425|nr:NlpC/P60 family protein [Ralstonia pickettii]WKZ86349.1 C40 family peptidase [Ralstonia pickettii]